MVCSLGPCSNVWITSRASRGAIDELMTHSLASVDVNGRVSSHNSGYLEENRGPALPKEHSC